MSLNDAFWYNLEQQKTLRFNVYDQRKAVMDYKFGEVSGTAPAPAPAPAPAAPVAFIVPSISAASASITPPQPEPTFQAVPQSKAKPARAAARLDDSPLTSKKPSSDIDKAQRIGTPGETIPIVFCRRAGTGIGGTWVQPSMVKTASKNFKGRFMYPISQGEIVGTPAKHRTLVGTRNLRYLKNQDIALIHDYATAASLVAAPSVCPIGGAALYCGIETYSYISQLYPAEVGGRFTEYVPVGVYIDANQITRGTGDTSNSVFYVATNSVEVFNSDTGDDVTAAFFAYLGITPGPSVKIVYNVVTAGGVIVGGRTVGTIADSANFEPDPAFDAALGLPAGSSAVIISTVTEVDNQVNLSNPASTGTLAGIQREYLVTPYDDPDVTPTADNSAYADITFLRVTGDIYDPPDGGSFPTTTKQLFIFYGNGVRVDKYSLGLVGGVYLKQSSNQLVDLVMYLFTIYKQADGAATSDIASPIFIGNLTSIAAFCDEYDLFFNGVLEETVNIIDIASALAPYFLLSFLSFGGQYRFEPLLPLAGNAIKLTALTPAATFTEDEILPGSFNKSFYAVAERQDFIATMLWRESNPSEIGIQRTKQVSFTTTALDAPIEQFDMTDFCVTPEHAVIYAKYELAKRKFSTHSIVFQTALITTGLKPTDIIKIQRQRISSSGDNRTEIEWYQITGITYGTDGGSTIEAEHFPVSSSDIAEISNSIINGSFRVL